MSKKRRFIGVILIVAALIAGICTTALASTMDEINANPEVKAEVEKIREKRYEVNQAKRSVAEANAELIKAEHRMEELDAVMAQAKDEIAAINEEEKECEETAKERMRTMYMYDQDWISMLFSSDDFTDMLTWIDSVQNVMQCDRDTVKQIAKIKEEKKAKIADYQVLQKEQESICQQKAAYKAKLEIIQKNAEAECEAEAAAGEALAQKYGLTLNGLNLSGDYIWPFDLSNPAAFNITDVFGERFSPYHGFHQGYDITAGYGEPILAIADATVAEASYGGGGYGNYVVLNHGQDPNSGIVVNSLYAHMSGINVSAGQSVKQGDVVGWLGSTGNSTGPHLHFSIMENGTFVDPGSYYPDFAGRFNYCQ